MTALLEIRDLAVDLPSRDGRRVPVLHDVTLEVGAREMVGLVGESGSGKTTLALATLGLLPPAANVRSGRVRWDGRELRADDGRELAPLRGREIGMVFQEPAAALTPVLSIGDQLVEVIRTHRRISGREARAVAIDLLRAVALPDPERRLRDLPLELSGGQRQRVVLALALAGSPRLILADEPTASLDVVLQAQVLQTIGELRDRLGLSVLLISHDVALVAERCDRVYVLYAGEILESGPATELFSQPRHPYTRALLGSLPKLRSRLEERRWPTIPGQAPSPEDRPSGCCFHPRCSERLPGCETLAPPWRTEGKGRGYRCVLGPQAEEGSP